MDSDWVFKNFSGLIYFRSLLKVGRGVEVIKALEWLELEAEFASLRVFSHILSSSEQAQKQWMPSQRGSTPPPDAEYLWQIAECWDSPRLLEQQESSREALGFQRLWDVPLSAFI